jgi:hypothetical protein
VFRHVSAKRLDEHDLVEARVISDAPIRGSTQVYSDGQLGLWIRNDGPVFVKLG